MIRLMEGLPENVVAAEAVGKVTAEDYESVLVPAVDEAASHGDKARMLLVLGSEFDGYEAEAVLDDMKMGMHTWGDFDRIAFVSDHDAYRALVKGMGFLMPGEVKVFAVDQLEAAKEWVAGVPGT